MPHSTRQTAIAAAVSIRTAAGCRWCGQRERDGVAVSAASLGVGLMHFGFEEFDSQDRRLVKETGWLPGLEGRFKLAWQRTTLSVDLAYYSGDVDYDGQTSSSVRIDSSTDEGILDISINAAYQLRLGLPPRVSVYAGGGYRHWDRDIESVGAVSGLDEAYQWWRAAAGARLRWPAGVNEWSLDGRLTRTVNPQVEVDFGNTFDAATLDLGARWGWRTAASWLRHVGPRLAAGLSVFYESWDLGQSGVETLISNGVPAGTVFQPRSESRNYGALLSLQRDW